MTNDNDDSKFKNVITVIMIKLTLITCSERTPSRYLLVQGQ